MKMCWKEKAQPPVQMVSMVHTQLSAGAPGKAKMQNQVEVPSGCIVIPSYQQEATATAGRRLHAGLCPFELTKPPAKEEHLLLDLTLAEKLILTLLPCFRTPQDHNGQEAGPSSPGRMDA